MGGAESCRTLSKRSEHPHVGRWHRSSLVLRSKSRGRSSTTPAQKKQLTCDFRWHGIDVSGTSKVVMGDRSSVNVAEKCSTTTVLQMHLCFRRSASFRRDGQLALVCIRNGPNGPFVSSDVGVHCRQHHVLLVWISTTYSLPCDLPFFPNIDGTLVDKFAVVESVEKSCVASRSVVDWS